MFYLEKDFQREIKSKLISRDWKNVEINKDECINKTFLEKSLFTYLKNRYSIDDKEIREINYEINKNLTNDWFKNNKLGIVDILKNGVSTKLTKKHQQKPYKLIDFKNLQNNVYEVGEEVWISENSRLDLVLFINGLPIFIFELKSTMNDEKTLKDAFHQIKGYLQSNNPKFATFNMAQIVAKNFNKAKIGSVCADSLDSWFNLFYKDEQVTSFFKIFSRSRIINYLKWGVLFSKNEKNGKTKFILRHHQYEAVIKMQKAISEGQSGYVWHTQGSGKTITISALISSLKWKSELTSTTTIIDVDRIDLSTNMITTLDKIDPQHFDYEEIRKAKSRNDLKTYLEQRSYKGVIVTTTQKFDSWGKVSDRKDIIVISDEAHRTHSTSSSLDSNETYYEKINKALPGSLKYGFTGTPIFETDKSTYAMFGKCIHKYTMKQAEIDEVIVPIQVQIISAPLKIKDKEKDNLLVNKKIIKRKEVIDGSKERLKFVTNSIKEKFITERVNHIALGNKDTFKAMVVTNSKKHGFNIFQALREIVFKNNDELIRFIADDKDRGDATVHKYLHNNRNEKPIWINEFKRPGSKIQIIVVVDMLLTGYDVPNLSLMFLDKKIQKHNLLQAITRVNRKFFKKEIGTVFSFRDIKSELKETLMSYRETTKDNSNLIKTSIKAEESIIKTIKKIRQNYKLDMFKIDFTNPLSEANSIKFKYENEKDFLNLIKEICNLSKLVIKWKNEIVKKIALIIKLIIKTHQMSLPSFIDITEEEFNKMLNATEINRKLIKEIKYASLDDIVSLGIMNEEIKIEMISNKLKEAIKKESSFSQAEKKTLLEQLKNIINKYNKENAIDIFSDLKDFSFDVNKNKNLNEYAKMLLLESKEIINRELNRETINSINELFENNGNVWMQTPAAKKNMKSKILEIIQKKEVGIVDEQIIQIISRGFNQIEERGVNGY